MMPVHLQQNAAGKVLILHIGGKLSKQDYDYFVPEVERLIGQYGQIRVLCHMHDFHGLTAGALWEDIKFDLKHFRHIERVAFLSNRKWQQGMAVFCKPFTTAQIQYFEESKVEEAHAWVAEGLEQPA